MEKENYMVRRKTNQNVKKFDKRVRAMGQRSLTLFIFQACNWNLEIILRVRHQYPGLARKFAIFNIANFNNKDRNSFLTRTILMRDALFEKEHHRIVLTWVNESKSISELSYVK